MAFPLSLQPLIDMLFYKIQYLQHILFTTVYQTIYVKIIKYTANIDLFPIAKTLQIIETFAKYDLSPLTIIWRPL